MASLRGQISLTSSQQNLFPYSDLPMVLRLQFLQKFAQPTLSYKMLTPIGGRDHALPHQDITLAWVTDRRAYYFHFSRKESMRRRSRLVGRPAMMASAGSGAIRRNSDACSRAAMLAEVSS